MSTTSNEAAKMFDAALTQVGLRGYSAVYVTKMCENNRATSQGINESASFRFLQRLSVIFGFRRDCL